MSTDTSRRNVLLLGRSQLVLDETVAALHDLGYGAAATNDFSDVTSRFDARVLDLVVFGGQVPPDQKAELRAELSTLNPRLIFVMGLAGIPGLIVNQVRGAFPAEQDAVAAEPVYTSGDRTIHLSLAAPADVTVTAWWQTSFVPPDPKSDSLVLLDDRLPTGEHAVAVSPPVPESAFATVQVDSAIYAFSIDADE
jgi:hypothetical protein